MVDRVRYFRGDRIRIFETDEEERDERGVAPDHPGGKGTQLIQPGSARPKDVAGKPVPVGQKPTQQAAPMPPPGSPQPPPGTIPPEPGDGEDMDMDPSDPPSDEEDDDAPASGYAAESVLGNNLEKVVKILVDGGKKFDAYKNTLSEIFVGDTEIKLKRRQRDNWLYAFTMEDKSEFQVSFNAETNMRRWSYAPVRVFDMVLAVQPPRKSFFGSKPELRYTPPSEPPANPRHGYSAEVYAKMFKCLNMFLVNAKPNGVKFTASNEKQTAVYTEMLSKLNLESIGYTHMVKNSFFEIKKGETVNVTKTKQPDESAALFENDAIESQVLQQLVTKIKNVIKSPSLCPKGSVKFLFEEGGCVFIDPKAQIVSTENKPADATMQLSFHTFKRMCGPKRTLDGTTAYRQGKLRVSGDMSVATTIAPLLYNLIY